MKCILDQIPRTIKNMNIRVTLLLFSIYGMKHKAGLLSIYHLI